MPKAQYVSQLALGDVVHAAFFVSEQQPSDGRKPHRFALTDRTGRIQAKCWHTNGQVSWDDIAAAGYAVIRGRVEINSHTSALEVTVDRLEPLAAPDDPADFLPNAEIDRDGLWREACALVKSIGNPALRNLLNTLFRDAALRNRFMSAPAAQFMHHPYLGGLLEHSLEVAHLCNAVAGKFRHLDRDLLVTAALLHDIGKVDEIDYSRPAFTSTRAGGMLGHVFLGAERVRAAIHAVPEFPDALADALCHLLLSHHGRLEYGSPVNPCSLEAYVLHSCDLLSTQAYYCRTGAAEAGGKEEFRKMAGLDGRLYTGRFGCASTAGTVAVHEVPEEYESTTPVGWRFTDPEQAPAVILPLLGTVAAGVPVEEQQDIEAYYPIPTSGGAQEGDFLLRVRGDSMIGAHILEGDILHVRPQDSANQGDIVVALVDQESTVKILAREGTRYVLRAANPAYADIVPEDQLTIQGRVVGVLRGLI